MESTTSADLEIALAGAATVTEAAEATVAHLEANGLTLPSLYLEQAGRLRCHAQRGYWQVLDGIPCDVGVSGRSFTSGETVEVTDAIEEPEFLFAAPDLCRQITVPVRAGEQVVGTINVEGRRAFPPDARAFLEAVAAAFERRLAELGGPPPETTAQRVARLVTALTDLETEAAIRATTLDSAVKLAGLSTAAVIVPEGQGRARLEVAAGPLADDLARVEPQDLAVLDGWVDAGSSLYANGTDDSGLVMHGRLRDAGVATLVMVPLTVGGEHLGSLLVASGTRQEIAPVVLPALEILAAQAAANLRTIRTVDRLHTRARLDPLTSLGHHATFQEELRARLADRRRGGMLAVLLIDVDDFKAVNDRHGHREGDRVLRQLSETLAGALRADDQLYRIGGDEFATVLEVDAVAEAQEVARRVVEVARTGPSTVSVGIAVACEDETADAIIDRADTAMYAAKAAGRDGAGLAPGADAHGAG